MKDIAGDGCDILVPFNERKPLKEIERSIITKYRKDIWAKFIKAIKEFQLINDGDRIAVAISGGKDSMLMAKLFQELKLHGHDNFSLQFIVADPGYHENIKGLMVDNCKYLNIPIKVFDSGIFRIISEVSKDYPCYMCAKIRRGALYNKAQELGCNKLALGHHFNDVIETTLLNILYTGNISTMLPKLKSSNFDGMEIIRPLYFIEEKAIEDFTQYNGIWPLNCACMVAAKKIGSKRNEVKKLIEQLKLTFDSVDKSIFKATSNVNMDCILGWQKSGIKYSFLDFYDEKSNDD
ncbi:tRNA 2-thiocytidine biosynthesis protein TtcA [Alkaliphilus pronyensis]|uniref:tRNA 2-thiocytidine biosynthesis protein TtcA n=1 Tax=Alkaliphilus pronyensis TaxID=1482732 RepID=A0A6I0F375_9FIRM|nr:ATP-binding protein [Alkaliphilus pronyensis]KAB3535782.1 tRNA 2-thiocytidine biosynthesis protein TtcA [Alkaliphilus pronyensis]